MRCKRPAITITTNAHHINLQSTNNTAFMPRCVRLTTGARTAHTHLPNSKHRMARREKKKDENIANKCENDIIWYVLPPPPPTPPPPSMLLMYTDTRRPTHTHSHARDREHFFSSFVSPLPLTIRSSLLRLFFHCHLHLLVHVDRLTIRCRALLFSNTLTHTHNARRSIHFVVCFVNQ